MTVSNKNTVFTYTSYKWTNDNDEKHWSPIVRTINGVKMDISGDTGLVEFRAGEYLVYATTKKILDDYISELHQNNELLIECN
jgi:hypothetical protein